LLVKRSVITGVGKYIPKRVVTNSDLERLMDTSDAWITERTGIKERHFADVENGENTSFMGGEAAKNAIKMAGLQAGDIDFIIFATLTPDHFAPGAGCFMQVNLGMQGIGALDIRNQCTGFIYGLTVANQFIRTGMYKNILVVGAEVHSTGLNLSTAGRDVAVLFGDGAGAVVVSGTDDAERGILSSHLHADGSFAKELWVDMPGSSSNPYVSHETIDSGRVYPYMNGRQVFKYASTKFPEVINEALAANGFTKDDVDLVVPHQANLRITEMITARLELPPQKVFSNIHKYGNTTAASIPIALTEAVEAGLIHEKSLVCMAAFGSGFTWGSCLIRW